MHHPSLPISPRPRCRRRILPAFRALLAAWALTAAATGQQILSVQAGGGTPYQTINQAIAAANPGDIIRIAPGTYAGFSCSKALRIEGAPGVVIDETVGYPASNVPAVSVGGVPTGGRFVLQNVELRGNPSYFNARVDLNSIGCTVIFDKVRKAAGYSDPPRIYASNITGGLLIGDSEVGVMALSNLTAHVVNTTIDGTGFDSGALVYLANSTMHMVDGSATINFFLGGRVFDLNNSRLTLGVVNGLPLTFTSFPGFGPTYHFAIDSTSSVVQHTLVTTAVNGTPQATPSFASGQANWVRDTTPISLRVATGAPGGSVATTVLGTGNPEVVALFVGTPVVPYTIPGVQGSIYLSSAEFLVNLGVVGAFGTAVTVSFTVPGNPVLLGLPLAIQGCTGTLRMTNAHGFTLR